MSTPIRIPAVAGTFYPGDPEQLRSEVRAFLAVEADPVPVLGCVVPHAGYMYSGHVAGALYARIAVPRVCLLMCPNHTGKGHALSIMSRGEWVTPLGRVPIDAALADALKESCPELTEDADAHRFEHSAEVQLPFLQVRHPHPAIVPIAIGTWRHDLLSSLGDAIAAVVAAHPEPVLIIASSDMNHYESDAVTRIKDQKAIRQILALQPQSLHETVQREDISMCGMGPAFAMLTAANALGADTAELVRYATSGDVSGDRDRVVGYAAIIVQ